MQTAVARCERNEGGPSGGENERHDNRDKINEAMEYLKREGPLTDAWLRFSYFGVILKPKMY